MHKVIHTSTHTHEPRLIGDILKELCANPEFILSGHPALFDGFVEKKKTRKEVAYEEIGN